MFYYALPYPSFIPKLKKELIPKWQNNSYYADGINNGNGFGNFVFCGTPYPYPTNGWISYIADSNIIQVSGNTLIIQKEANLNINVNTTSSGAGGSFKVYKNGSSIINMSYITGYSPSGTSSYSFSAVVGDKITIAEDTESGYSRPFCVRMYKS